MSECISSPSFDGKIVFGSKRALTTVENERAGERTVKVRALMRVAAEAGPDREDRRNIASKEG